MSTEETSTGLDARQRELAVLLAAAGIYPRTATFGEAADALAKPGGRARPSSAVRDTGRRLPVPSALAAALATHRFADAGPVFGTRPSVATFEEFREQWIALAPKETRPTQQRVHRGGGLADDDAVAEQP